MTSLSCTENPAIVGAYDFSGITTLVDVGGGHGSLVAEILRATPSLRGVVYDRPEVIEAPSAYLTVENLASPTATS